MKWTTSTAYSHTKKEMRERLEKEGWHTWYNDNYWVHPKVVQNPEIQDYTNYGMSLEDAFMWNDTKIINPRLTIQLYEVCKGIILNTKKFIKEIKQPSEAKDE